jgi:hypothetical protein
VLPRLSEMQITSPLFVDMFVELRARGFEGDLSVTSAESIVQATDNSIYQVLPQAMAFPRTIEDLVSIARLTCDNALSWRKYVDASAENRNLLGTGYSCRSQVALIDGVTLLHPIQALLGDLRVHAGEPYASVAQAAQVGDLPLSVA